MENIKISLCGFRDCSDFLGITEGLSSSEKKLSAFVKTFLGKLDRPYFSVIEKVNARGFRKDRTLNFEEFYNFEKDEVVFYEEDFLEAFADHDEYSMGDVEDYTEVIEHRASDYLSPSILMDLEEVRRNKKASKKLFELLEENFAPNRVFYLNFSLESFIAPPKENYASLKEDVVTPYYEDIFNHPDSRLVETGRIVASLFFGDKLLGRFYLDKKGGLSEVPQNVLSVLSICDKLHIELDKLYLANVGLDKEERKKSVQEATPNLNKMIFEYWDAYSSIKEQNASYSVA